MSKRSIVFDIDKKDVFKNNWLILLTGVRCGKSRTLQMRLEVAITISLMISRLSIVVKSGSREIPWSMKNFEEFFIRLGEILLHNSRFIGQNIVLHKDK